MALVVLFVVTVYYLCSGANSYILKGTENGCLENGTRQCCSGYFEMNKSCHECVGSYGPNCTNSCPIGWYGKRCMENCSCADCDPVRGCSPETQQSPAAPLNSQLLRASPTHNSTSIQPDADTPISSDKITDLSLDTTHSIPTDPLSEYSDTTLGRWYTLKNLKNFVQSLHTKDWVIFGIVVFVLLILTKVGVRTCKKSSRKKMGIEHTHDEYIELERSRQAASGDYTSIAENEYTDVKVYDRINESTLYSTDGNET